MKALTQYVIWIAMPLMLLAGCGGGDDAPEPAAMEDTTSVEAMAPAASAEFEAELSGAEEVPGPGDEDGSGEAEVELNADDGTVCFEIEVEDIEEPQAAHIHSGAAGESGPPVVNFDVATNGLEGCVDADAATIQSIMDNPANYYVNVHNAEFGGGAVRGQLSAGM